MKYRKKPVVIEAMQLNWNNWDAMCDFADVGELANDKPQGCNLNENGNISDIPTDIIGLLIPTLEGVMLARQGDYVIKGIRGELYSCKPDIFEETYEEVL